MLMIAKIGPIENRTNVLEVNLHHQKLYDGIPILDHALELRSFE